MSVECAKFSVVEGRLILRDEEERIVYVANVDRWLSFEVDREEKPQDVVWNHP